MPAYLVTIKLITEEPTTEEDIRKFFDLYIFEGDTVVSVKEVPEE